MQQTKNNEVVFFEEPSVSLRTTIAVNDTTLGPAIATCKLQDYKNPEDSVKSALSMAYYNTYRAALLHKGFGGAGLSLCGNPKKVKNEMYFRALGISLNKMGGKLYLVRSSSVTHKDMLDIKRESDFLLGIDERYIKANNSTVQTIAKGMIEALKAIVRKSFNAETLSGFSFVIQGVGEIGSNFIKELLKIDDISVTITDTVYDKIKIIQDHNPNVKVVKPNEIYKEKCDIFVSCAINNIIGKEESKQLNCKILTGSSNEILKSEKVEETLSEKNILFVPGFVINGGEIILLDNELKGNEPETVELDLCEIFHSTEKLLEKAEKTEKTVRQVAKETAENYIKSVASIKKLK